MWQRRCAFIETRWYQLPKSSRGSGGALLLTDHYTGEGVSISVWESEDDMHASEASGFYHRKLDQLDALFISQPVRKHYEVSIRV
jgi:hypothetical protein